MKCGIRLVAGLAGALALGTVAAPLAAQESVIQLPPGYRVEKVVYKLSYATSLTWDDQGRMSWRRAATSWRSPGPPASCASRATARSRSSPWGPSRPCGPRWSGSSGTTGPSTSHTGPRTARAPFPA